MNSLHLSFSPFLSYPSLYVKMWKISPIVFTEETFVWKSLVWKWIYSVVIKGKRETLLHLISIDKSPDLRCVYFGPFWDVFYFFEKSLEIKCVLSCRDTCCYLILTGCVFSVSKPGRGDSGLYACTANNSLGSVNTTASLTVEFPPEFPPDHQRVFLSWDQRPVTLHCQGELELKIFWKYFWFSASGLPSPTITWWLNGSQIGRAVLEKNFKIRGLRTSQSELFVLPTTDRLVRETLKVGKLS